MILTKNILGNYLIHRNSNLLLYGTNITYLTDLFRLSEYTECEFNKFIYFKLDSYYHIDVSTCKKKSILFELLDLLCVSPNYYSIDHFKKIIIVTNISKIGSSYIQRIKRIIDNTYLSCAFILHTDNLHSIDDNIKSRCVLFSLPRCNRIDLTLGISYRKTIKLLKKPLTKRNIESIRDLSYHYYMNHKNSIELQKLFIIGICSNHSLPNSIKYAIVEDITKLNTLYQYSYRKPIFLECIIFCLFKHLEHYTINL